MMSLRLFVLVCTSLTSSFAGASNDWIALNSTVFYGDHCDGQAHKADAEQQLIDSYPEICQSDTQECKTEVTKNASDVSCSGTNAGRVTIYYREAQVPITPEECVETGQFYNPATQECASECVNGSMDNQCLTTPDQTCTEASADYQGTVGWGEDHRAVCSGDTSCGDNERFAYNQLNDGTWSGVCISNDTNPPTCPYGFDGVLEIYDNGFACGQLNEDKESDKNDSSDGDSDGDGQADDNGMAGQLEDIKGLLRDGNTETGNIGESLKKGFGDLTEAIGDIPGGGGGSGDDGNGEGEGEPEEPVTWSGEPIDTELTDPTEQYDQVMADYQAKINEIKGEVQAMFSTNLAGGGSVDDNIKSIHGVEVNFSLNRFLDGLNILGAIVLFCAAFISAGILFSGRG